MRFAITAVDQYQDVFNALLEKGWEPVKLFCVPNHVRSEDNSWHVVRTAQKCKIPIQVSPMTDDDLRDLGQRGCDILVGAGYRWRIGDWRPHIPYAVNFHPSPLPVGRGAYPFVRAIQENHTQWGVTCHKFDRDFDTGDILAREEFAIAPEDNCDSLVIKCEMASRRLAHRVADNFTALWNEAQPQGQGSYWKRYTNADRTLDFTQPVATIMRQVAAFGSIEVIAPVNGAEMHVRRAVGWEEQHGHAPGTLVHNNLRHLVVAARDGYIGLVEWSFMEPYAYSLAGR